MSCVCKNNPSLSVNATIESDSLWSETIDFSEKIIDTTDIDNVIETITNTVKKTKTVCSDRKKRSCNETCNTACRCGKIARKKVCACKLFGVDKLCDTTCKTVTETYCEGVDTFEDIVNKTKIPVKTEFYIELTGNISMNLYANTEIGAGTGSGAGGAKAGSSLYLVIQLSIKKVKVVGKLKVKGKQLGGFSISENSLQMFPIPPIVAIVSLKAEVDINKLKSFKSFWDFLNGEIAACVGIKQLSLNYNLGGTNFTLGNPTFNLCADPKLRKIVLSVQGSINHTFAKIKNTNTTPKISTGFSLPIPIPIG
jgi:hypothetical protein